MVNFKYFKVGDLFIRLSIRYLGQGNKTDNVSKIKNEEFSLPLTYAKQGDNGIMYWGRPHEWENYRNVLAVVTNGAISTGLVYPHKDNVGVLGESYLLKLKEEKSFNVYQYLATALEKAIFYKYSREFLATWNNKVENDLILLPVTPDGTPDYAYMDDYIKGIQRQYIDNLLETNESERDRLLSIVGLSLDEYESVKGNIELSEATSYGEFKVGDLFEITNGGRVTKQDQVEGSIPYVTATTENNGIESYISNPKFTKTDLITVSFFGDTYYHPYEIGFKDGTYGLELLGKKSKYIYLYLTSVLHKRFKGQGSYSQMLTGNVMSEMFIQLPIISTGEIDYAYMEDYISKIKLIYIYNRELSVNHKVELLKSITDV